jgi:hypothetical protein
MKEVGPSHPQQYKLNIKEGGAGVPHILCYQIEKLCFFHHPQTLAGRARTPSSRHP